MLLLLGAGALLVLGYIFYGGYLAKQWGIDPDRPTPAHEMEDGVDYVAAPPYVVLGHHFSSIAGAGPINGPIQASIFGWLPVALWVILGGIFMGAMHDFGSLFASLRHKGQTLASVVSKNIDDTAKRLFIVFAYLTLVLVVAAFASIVANTFAVGLENQTEAAALANSRTAMISVLFIVAAVIWGLATRGRQLPAVANIVAAIVVIVAVIAIGFNFPVIQLGYKTWMIIIGIYILIASVAPVWILLQPRDYLSSYLLYGMIIMAVVAILGASIMGAASHLDIPMFRGFVTNNLAFDAATGEALVDEAGAAVVNKAAQGGFLFPALFVTIACGAISGFHSLVASGTTSKQLDRESQAKPIAYGGMLLESFLAIISLIAVGYVWTQYAAGEFASPTAIFAGGLSQMLGTIPGLSSETVTGLAYSLLILAVSAFCLTSLDTATRLARYMFQEFFTPTGQSADQLTGVRLVMANKWVATIITVAVGVALGLGGYSIVWPLFGAANQLLAALALLAVAAWLANAGKNNKMFYFPMVFMLAVTLTSLGISIYQRFGVMLQGGTDAMPMLNATLQTVIAVILFVLALVLAVKGAKVIFGKKEAAQQA